MSEDLSINDFNTATETLLQGVDAKMKLNNDKLDSVVSNTANIKASIEVGGDLYVSQDEVEAKLDTIASRLIDDSNSVATSNNAINTNVITANSKLDTIITNTAASSSTGLATEAKQDVMEASLTSIETDIESTNTKLDTIAGRLIDDSNSVANSNNAINTNVITQNTNFFNKAAFLQASVDAESSPPSGTTEILLTQDVPMQFKMTTLTSSTDAISTNLATTNSKLTTIDTDTGNIDTKLGVLNTTTSANNTIQAAIKTDTGNILNQLTQNGDGTGNAAGVILDAINTNTITQNSKIDSTNTKLDTLETTLTAIETDAAALETLQTSTNTKLDTLETTLTAIETDAAALETLQTSTNTKLDTLETSLTAIEADIESVIGTASAAHSTGHGVILMGKVGDLSSDGIHSDSGIAQNDAQFVACDGEGNIGVTIRGGLMENSLTYNSGNKDATTQRVVIATDDIPIALVNTKLDTLEATLTNIETDAAANEVLLTTISSRLIDDSNSVANSNNAINTNTISGNSKLDTIISNTAEISDVKTSIDTMQGDHTLTDLHTLLNGGLPSTLESDKLKVDDEDTHTKLDTLETTLTAIETDVAALEVLQTATNTKLDTLETSLTSMESKLDTMITHLATIAGDTTSLDGKLSASNTSGHYGNS